MPRMGVYARFRIVDTSRSGELAQTLLFVSCKVMSSSTHISALYREFADALRDVLAENAVGPASRGQLASLMLNTMPIAAKDQIGLLKDFKFVKVADDKILLVDPATRKIVDTVTKEDAQ